MTAAQPESDRTAPLRDPSEPWRRLYPFGSHWHATPDGHRIHYLDEGPRDAPPLLLLHGNPTWSFYWRTLVEGLRGTRRLVAPDHLGCGLSDKPQHWPYRLRGHVDNAVGLVRELDLRNITLVVHDWGGAIGMGVAAQVPERIGRLVVLNTAAFRSTAIPLRIAACRWPLVGPLAVRGFNAFARAALTMATEKGLAPDVRAGYLAPYDSWQARVAIQRFVEDIPLAPSHPSYATLVQIEEALPLFVDTPMLLVWGDRDWCFTPAFRAEWQRRFPQAEVHALPDVGHYVMEDAGSTVLDLVRGFVARPCA